MSVSRNTAALLQKLRIAMKNTSPAIQAYIVPSEDAHMSEYIAPCDARRGFISNFTGSSGCAVVTDRGAALWTDGRYFLQASQQLDENWVLMKMGLPDTPSQVAWLSKELPSNSMVGVDPNMISQRGWDSMVEEMESTSLTLVATAPNLIDPLWMNQPSRPSLPTFVQPLQFAGSTWQERVARVRVEMKKRGAETLVVSALDDVAWLLNLRGSDVPYNPVFFAFVFVTSDVIYLCIEGGKVGGEVREHLGKQEDDFKVRLRDYSEAGAQLHELVQATKALVWISPLTNTALCNLVPKHRQLKRYSPIAEMKSVKNEAELKGMQECHVRDGAALCEFLKWLESEVVGREVTEIEAADYATECRKRQHLYVSLSFSTISSAGANASIIHYSVTADSNKIISPNELFLFDSGAQYRDGTTDVTRTVHFTQPSLFEQECFTRVLKGHIALETAIFPNGCKGLYLDCLARQHLWNVGLDYRHGTSHGVGSFLNVHEGPCGIAQRTRPEDVPLKQGMVLSNEPGYYEDGKFGIRIENLFVVVAKETLHNHEDTGFLTFRSLTLVPLQSKLILKSILTPFEISWVNAYHKRVREEVGAELRKSGREDVFDWLTTQTQEI